MSAVMTEIHTFFDSRGSFNWKSFIIPSFALNLKPTGLTFFNTFLKLVGGNAFHLHRFQVAY